MAGFYARQVDDKRTPWQVFFDVAFGIVLPMICLIFDPFVFRRTEYQVLAHCFIGIQMALLAVWLFLGERAAPVAGLFGGAFLLGYAVAAAVGLMLLPLSLIGLILIVGALGFTPFFTAFVFYRNARRAFRMAAKQGAPTAMFFLAGVASICIILLSVGFHSKFDKPRHEKLEMWLHD